MYNKQSSGQMAIQNNAGANSTKHKRHASHAGIPNAGAKHVNPAQNQLHQYQEGGNSMHLENMGGLRPNKHAQSNKNSSSGQTQDPNMMQDLVKHFNKGSLSKNDLKLLQKYCEQKGLNYQSVILGAAAAAQNTPTNPQPPTNQTKMQARQQAHSSVGLHGASGGQHHSNSQKSLDGQDKFKAGSKLSMVGNAGYRKASDSGIVALNERQLIPGQTPDKNNSMPQKKPHQGPGSQPQGNYPHPQQHLTASNGYFTQQPSPVRISSSSVVQTNASSGGNNIQTSNSGKQTPDVVLHPKNSNNSQNMKKQSLFVYDSHQQSVSKQERPQSSSSRTAKGTGATSGQQNANSGNGNAAAQATSAQKASTQIKMTGQHFQRHSSQHNINPNSLEPGAKAAAYSGKQNPFKRPLAPGTGGHHNHSQGSLDSAGKGSMPKYASGHHSQKASMVSGSGSVLVHQNNNYISGGEPVTSTQGGVVYYLPQSNKTEKNQMGSHNIKLNKGGTQQTTNQQKNTNLSHKRSKSKQNTSIQQQHQYKQTKQQAQQYSQIHGAQTGMPQGLVQSLIHGMPQGHHHAQYQHRSGAMTSAPNSPSQGKNSQRIAQGFGAQAPQQIQKPTKNNTQSATNLNTSKGSNFVIGGTNTTGNNIHLQNAVNSVTSQSSMVAYLANSQAGITPGGSNLSQRKSSQQHNSQKLQLMNQNPTHKGAINPGTGKQNLAHSSKQSPHQLHAQLPHSYANEYNLKQGAVKMHHSLQQSGNQIDLHSSGGPNAAANQQLYEQQQRQAQAQQQQQRDPQQPQPRMQASQHHHSSSQPTLPHSHGVIHAGFKSNQQPSTHANTNRVVQTQPNDGPVRTHASVVASNAAANSNTAATTRKNLREMGTPQLILNKHASMEALQQQQQQQHQSNAIQKGQARQMHGSSSVPNVAANQGGNLIKQLQQNLIGPNQAQQPATNAQYSGVRPVASTKIPGSDIKPVLQKNASQSSLRAQMSGVAEPYTHPESQRKKQLMMSGNSNPGNQTNSSVHMSEKKHQGSGGTNGAPNPKLQALQAQYASDQSTGASVRRRQQPGPGHNRMHSNQSKQTGSSGTVNQHYKARQVNKNSSGVAPYDHSDQSKQLQHQNTGSVDDSNQSLQRIHQVGSMGSNYAAPQPIGQLHASGGANINYPEGENDEKAAAKGMNLALAPVSGSASSSHRHGFGSHPNPHKRTSSVTNNTSSGGTGSLVRHGSGGNINSSGVHAPSSVASSQRRVVPSSGQSKHVNNHPTNPQHRHRQNLPTGSGRLSQNGSRRVSQHGSQESSGQGYVQANGSQKGQNTSQHRPQRQMRSDQRKPPGPIKEHLMEDSPIISSLEQFQLEIELRHREVDQLKEQQQIEQEYAAQQQRAAPFNKQHRQQQLQGTGEASAGNSQQRPSTATSRRKDTKKVINQVKMEHLQPPSSIKHISSKEMPLPDGVDQSDAMSNRPLLTEEEEHGIKQVAADINERAFYGKLMKVKKTLKNNSEFAKLSPRSQEIGGVMRSIKSSFDETGLPPTTQVNFYRVGKVLGRGAFGKVNLAMQKLVRKLVALKSLNKEALTDVEQKTKLMKEVNLLLKLRHNHVVKIYETIETEKHIIIVMELCAGGDLLNYVRKRRKLKEPYAQKIFKQIIDGLCYIHSKLIAHRDIKLDNILLDGRGNVKIADFGVSKQTIHGAQMKEQCGTPAYIAPEILRNKGYGLNVDLWSAGVVLFAMLYGTVPFKAQTMNELHQLILKGKYVLKEDVSANARNLLRGLLEINPEKRLTIKQIYEHPWLKSMDTNVQLFNDEEREMIKKEYTYNDASRYNRNENEEVPVDCFTEHNFESIYSTLKNHSSKSIILAPFNSTMSEESATNIELMLAEKEMQDLMEDKQRILRFSKKVREIDRQYEFNNNGQLDNGVYHKNIANNSFEQNNAEDSQSEGGIEIEQSLSQGTLVENKSKAHNLLSKQLKAQQSSTRSVDQEMVVTYETFQDQNNKGIADDESVKKLCSFGYPTDYVMYTLRENEPNYCTAGYYLLEMDQNYC